MDEYRRQQRVAQAKRPPRPSQVRHILHRQHLTTWIRHGQCLIRSDHECGRPPVLRAPAAKARQDAALRMAARARQGDGHPWRIGLLRRRRVRASRRHTRAALLRAAGCPAGDGRVHRESGRSRPTARARACREHPHLLHAHADAGAPAWIMMISTGRPPTLAPQGMVACPHALASAAGVDVLRAGGSAVDAAIATSAALAVLYPHMTGVGGDAFWLIYDAAAQRVRYLDGGGRAAAAATIERFAQRGLAEIPFRGILPATVTTPGAVASWVEAHASYGRLPLARVLESAIAYARDGFPVTARLARWIRETAPEFGAEIEWQRIFMPQGEPPRPGAMLSNPDLARTLDAIADRGWAGFYDGDIAQELVRYAQARGGLF